MAGTPGHAYFLSLTADPRLRSASAEGFGPASGRGGFPPSICWPFDRRDVAVAWRGGDFRSRLCAAVRLRARVGLAASLASGLGAIRAPSARRFVYCLDGGRAHRGWCDYARAVRVVVVHSATAYRQPWRSLGARGVGVAGRSGDSPAGSRAAGCAGSGCLAVQPPRPTRTWTSRLTRRRWLVVAVRCGLERLFARGYTAHSRAAVNRDRFPARAG